MLIYFLEKHLLGRRKRRPILEALLIDLSAIFVWRGLWGLMDIYFFPTYPQVSFLFSILFGIALFWLTRLLGKRFL